MSFYQRHGLVRAIQWFTHGDSVVVGQGVHTTGGTLDIRMAAPYSRRHVEPGDWIIREGSGKHVVITDAEFKNNYKAV